jgi:hypothetical protein
VEPPVVAQSARPRAQTDSASAVAIRSAASDATARESRTTSSSGSLNAQSKELAGPVMPARLP